MKKNGFKLFSENNRVWFDHYASSQSQIIPNKLMKHDK